MIFSNEPILLSEAYEKAFAFVAGECDNLVNDILRRDLNGDTVEKFKRLHEMVDFLTFDRYMEYQDTLLSVKEKAEALKDLCIFIECKNNDERSAKMEKVIAIFDDIMKVNWLDYVRTYEFGYALGYCENLEKIHKGKSVHWMDYVKRD